MKLSKKQIKTWCDSFIARTGYETAIATLYLILNADDIEVIVEETFKEIYQYCKDNEVWDDDENY